MYSRICRHNNKSFNENSKNVIKSNKIKNITSNSKIVQARIIINNHCYLILVPFMYLFQINF